MHLCSHTSSDSQKNPVLFSLSYFMDEFTGCLSHGDPNDTVIFRKKCFCPLMRLAHSLSTISFRPGPTLVPQHMPLILRPSHWVEYIFDGAFWVLLHLGLLHTFYLLTSLLWLPWLMSCLTLTVESGDFLLVLLEMWFVGISLHLVVLLFLLFGIDSRRGEKIPFLWNQSC